MIKITRGNILLADAEALVNTVNCVGFMGKGIALQFKKAYPANFTHYQRSCKAGEVKLGEMFIVNTGTLVNPKYIVNFPTKGHWREKSRIYDIKQGLSSLRQEIISRKIQSIAIPPLGCGLGGLDWSAVKELIIQALQDLDTVTVLLFEPIGAPDAKTMPIGTPKPKLTIPRAMLIKIMSVYTVQKYRLTLLEIQKLAYFLQEAGEPLRLRYEAGVYGPYAPNLNKVLEVLEGHFTRGYGDNQKPDVDIELLPDASNCANDFLTAAQESKRRLDRVEELISGFETPYGMELLASTHWVGKHHIPKAENAEQAIEYVQKWSPRKGGLFRADHITLAWNELAQQKWLP